MDRRRILLGLAAALAAAPAPPRAAEAAGRARARVAALVAEVHAALIDAAADPAARDRRIREAVADAFGLGLWRRAVLGAAAEDFTAAQLAAVDAALPGYLARLYVDRFAGTAGRRPELGAVRPLRRDVLVDVAMFRRDAPPLALEYRVRDVEGAAQVIDVIVGGVSFALLKREEFRSILNRGGPPALVAYLESNAL